MTTGRVRKLALVAMVVCGVAAVGATAATGAEGPQITDATIVDAQPDQLRVTFDQPVTATTADGFLLSATDSAPAITGHRRTARNTVVVQLSAPVDPVPTGLNLTYDSSLGTVTGVEGTGAQSADSIEVRWVGPTVERAVVSDAAPSELRVEFHSRVTARDASGFHFDTREITGLDGSPQDPTKTIRLTLDDPITSELELALEYDGTGTLRRAADNRSVRSIGGITVINRVGISGTVVDFDTGAPVDDATVTAGNATATTGSDGRFGLPADSTRTLTVTADGYDPRTVSAEPGEDVRIRLGQTAAFSFQIESGSLASVGVPVPTEQTVGEVFGDGAGVVYAYTDGNWTIPDPDRRVEAMDAFVVRANDSVSATIVTAGTSPPTNELRAPADTTLEPGWNFVAATEAGPPEAAFSVADRFEGTYAGPFDSPAVAPGTERAESGNLVRATPFVGYFVFSESGRAYGSEVTTHMTRRQVLAALNVTTAQSPTPTP